MLRGVRLLSVWRLVDDVRTRYLDRDPKLLKLILSIEAIEQLLPDDVKEAA